MGEKVKEAIQTELAARELRQKPKLTRFVLQLRRFAKERGMKI
jgi:pantoate kinase